MTTTTQPWLTRRLCVGEWVHISTGSDTYVGRVSAVLPHRVTLETGTGAVTLRRVDVFAISVKLGA